MHKLRRSQKAELWTLRYSLVRSFVPCNYDFGLFTFAVLNAGYERFV